MRPGRSLVTLSLLWLLTGAVSFFYMNALPIWLYAALAVLPVIILDLCILTLLPSHLSVARSVSPVMALGKEETVLLRLHRHSGGYLPSRMRLFDMYPDSFICSAFPLLVTRQQWAQGSDLEIRYHLMPATRGSWDFNNTEVLLTSPLFMWRRRISIYCRNEGKTYPDFKRMLSLAAPGLKGAYQSIGIKSRRKRGEGMDFLSLRDYREGDSIRTIDWRATSRRGKPIVREYSESQDQQVLLILDTGYRLYRSDGEFLQFDHALNAVLMLAHTALTHGDSVAFSSFGNDDRWIPPRKGKTAISGLLHRLYDLQCGPVPSSPFQALEKAMDHLHKCSFIILVSNLREEDGESLSWILPRLNRQHLLLAVSLSESDTRTIIHRRPVTTEEKLEKAAAVSYVHAREKMYRHWEHLGLLTLESVPDQLTSRMINTYLDVKRSGRL
ncbi:MAG: DUF58 domain-containing protein [Spirochaetales bacterium]|nr:DUF58 domain-containing protein [Spirochaetales bacterium]